MPLISSFVLLAGLGPFHERCRGWNGGSWRRLPSTQGQSSVFSLIVFFFFLVVGWLVRSFTHSVAEWFCWIFILRTKSWRFLIFCLPAFKHPRSCFHLKVLLSPNSVISLCHSWRVERDTHKMIWKISYNRPYSLTHVLLVSHLQHVPTYLGLWLSILIRSFMGRTWKRGSWSKMADWAGWRGSMCILPLANQATRRSSQVTASKERERKREIAIVTLIPVGMLN